MADSLVYIIDVIVFKISSKTFYESFNKEWGSDVIVDSIEIDISFIIVYYFEYFFLDRARNAKTLAAIILVSIKNKAVVGKEISFYGSAGFT